MWFVSKKKYDTLLAQKEDFERIATNAVTQNGRLLDHWKGAMEEMKSIQELNHRLVEHNEELLARVKELEDELEGARQDNQRWADEFEELDIAYGELEIERDRYKERVDAFEEGKYIVREAE